MTTRIQSRAIKDGAVTAAKVAADAGTVCDLGDAGLAHLEPIGELHVRAS